MNLRLQIGIRVWDLDLALDHVAKLATDKPVELSNYYLAEQLVNKNFAIRRKSSNGKNIYSSTPTTDGLLDRLKDAITANTELVEITS
jgi:hypothetical protein